MNAELRGIPPVKEAKFRKLRLSREKPFTIGRFEGASLQIRDVKVSRKPALFEYDGDRWTVTDKSSMNGVYVNDSQIPTAKPHALSHGDVIKLGPIQDYRWIFFLNEEEKNEGSSSPPSKKIKSESDSQNDVESQMIETMEKIEKKRKSLQEKMKESEEKARKLLTERNDLTKTLKIQNDELAQKLEIERRVILTKLNHDDDIQERERKLADLEERLNNEKFEIEKQSRLAVMAVEAQISEKTQILEDNRKTINSLLLEKQKAEECLLREKRVFEDKLSVLRSEFDAKLRNEEAYKNAVNELTEEMEGKLKESKYKMESMIEKERREKENLQVEFEKMKEESSKAVRRLEDVMGACEEEFKCTICDEIFIQPMTTNCGHVFCDYCISKWKNKCKDNNFTCPNCRLPITSKSRNHYLENLIESLIKKFGDDIKLERNMLVQSRAGGGLSISDDNDETKDSDVHPLIRIAATRRNQSNSASRRKRRR